MLILSLKPQVGAIRTGHRTSTLLRLSKAASWLSVRVRRPAIADSNVLHCRADGLVAQALPHQREVDVRGNQVAGQGVLEYVGMPLLRRQPGSLGAGAEDTKELRAV